MRRLAERFPAFYLANWRVGRRVQVIVLRLDPSTADEREDQGAIFSLPFFPYGKLSSELNGMKKMTRF